jgi:hypothetical protein
MAQTIWIKGQIEIMRSSNTFGTLIWQLNEKWPRGGWGTIEYGPSRILKGQLVGGRWELLMYLPRQSLITIQVNELGNGTASLQLSTDRLVLYLFVSTEAEGRFSENSFHLRPYERKFVCKFV